MKKIHIILIALLSCLNLLAQEDIITNIPGRKTVSLNGTWHYLVDPYETGFYDYRYKEYGETNNGAYWNTTTNAKKTELVEHMFKDTAYTINVPGDWNSQDRQFLYYEGTVWYQRDFDKPQVAIGEDVYLYFGAVNYEAHVYLNGKKLGMHKGGFTPFNFKIPQGLLKDKGNFLVVKVDNKRHADEVPTLNTDWWNFGGITRDVDLVVVPQHFIRQYSVQLDQKQDINVSKRKKAFAVTGWVKLNEIFASSKVDIEIPELKLKKEFTIQGDSVHFDFNVNKLSLWSPENPKLYNVKLSLGQESVSEKVGFRKIEASGKKIILNGDQIFLRGISIHEEIPQDVRRAHSKKDATQLLSWAKELNVNMVRLAHYPHNENMTRMADSLGILVWSEIPVYWTIDFGNPAVLKKAEKQLQEMVARDVNRASVIIWSVGNETPVSPVRTTFMSTLIKRAKQLDNTRLISAALEISHAEGGLNKIDDPLGAFADLVSVNEYLGWYVGLPDICQTAKWETIYDKPLFISETGADAKFGFHADKYTRFSEEYQEWYYEEQIKMFERFPENYSGISPWILADFRSPKRNNTDYQQGWNRKGLIDDKGNKKKAFYVLQAYYNKMEKLQKAKK